MRSALLSFSLAATTLVCSGQSTTTDGSPAATIRDIAPAQLATMIGTPNVFVYDCNEPEVFDEAHVPGAKPLVYDEISADKLPADHNATLVFYCYSPECPAGVSAAHTATSLGFADVYCMIAGITGWQDAGQPTEP